MKNEIVRRTKIKIIPTATTNSQSCTLSYPGAIHFVIVSDEKKYPTERIIQMTKYLKANSVILLMLLFFIQLSEGLKALRPQFRLGLVGELTNYLPVTETKFINKSRS